MSRPALVAAVLVSLAGSSPAAAQWTPVAEVPASNVYSVWASGDTLVAGADGVVHVSTDAGATWKQSAALPNPASMIRATLIHEGRIYAGTLGEGVYVSGDFGDTWSSYSQGLVGGIGNSVLTIAGMTLRGDSLYAATVGAAAWVRNIRSGPWSPYGSQTIEAFQAANMDAISTGGARLLATGGFNGTVFYRDIGQPDWTVSLLFNDRFAPGLAGLDAIWTGHRWVVGTNIGMFVSDTGAEPWTYVDLGLRSLLFVGLALHGTDVYASLDAGGGTLIAVSHDDGSSWQALDTLTSALTFRLAVNGDELYAGRADGLWRRPLATSVSTPHVDSAPALRFALSGSQPVGDEVHFHAELPVAEPVRLEFFDVAGRRVAETIRDTWSAGPHEVEWNARELAPGVYLACLTAGTRQAVVRLIRTR